MTTIRTITPLPTAPSSTDPDEFETQADAWVAGADVTTGDINNTVSDMNTVAGEVSDNADDAAASATAAAGSATAASGSATTATTQAGIATTKAAAAATSATNAEASESNAAGYASALAGNINASRTVDLVATANVAIATGLANGQTLDGVTIVTGYRILLTAQSTASQNGIYSAPASGSASRATDADTAAELASGSIINVTRGTSGAGTAWRHTTAPGFTLGSTSLTFVKRGELQQSAVSSGVTMASATAKTVQSLLLSAGEWDVDGFVQFSPIGATMTVIQGGISTTNNILPGTVDESFFQDQGSFTANQIRRGGSLRIALTSTTPVYLVGYCAFTGTSVTTGGKINARRVNPS